MAGVSCSPRIPAPSATATAGLRYVTTVARAAPISAMSRK
jgi:hypothetical protein